VNQNNAVVEQWCPGSVRYPPLRRAVELDRREEYSDMGWLKVSGEEIRG